MSYYPRGKLNKNDEGAAVIKIFSEDKTVIIDFGKDIKWIGFDKDTAIKIAHALLEHANEIDKPRTDG